MQKSVLSFSGLTGSPGSTMHAAVVSRNIQQQRVIMPLSQMLTKNEHHKSQGHKKGHFYYALLKKSAIYISDKAGKSAYGRACRRGTVWVHAAAPGLEVRPASALRARTRETYQGQG